MKKIILLSLFLPLISSASQDKDLNKSTALAMLRLAEKGTVVRSVEIQDIFVVRDLIRELETTDMLVNTLFLDSSSRATLSKEKQAICVSEFGPFQNSTERLVELSADLSEQLQTELSGVIKSLESIRNSGYELYSFCVPTEKSPSGKKIYTQKAVLEVCDQIRKSLKTLSVELQNTLYRLTSN